MTDRVALYLTGPSLGGGGGGGGSGSGAVGGRPRQVGHAAVAGAVSAASPPLPPRV